MGNGASVGLSGLIGEDDVEDCEHPGDMVVGPSRRRRGARATSDGHNVATTTSATGHQQPYHDPRPIDITLLISGRTVAPRHRQPYHGPRPMTGHQHGPYLWRQSCPMSPAAVPRSSTDRHYTPYLWPYSCSTSSATLPRSSTDRG